MIRSANGPALLATIGFYPMAAGTSFFMQNLVMGMQPGEVVVASMYTKLRLPRHVTFHGHPVEYVLRGTPYRKVNRLLNRYQSKGLADRLARVAERHGCSSIVGIYPDLTMLSAAADAANLTGLPFYPYIHDTILESHLHLETRALAEEVQKKVFATMVRPIVITDSLRDLYKDKYGLECLIVRHPYADPIAEAVNPAPAKPSALWSGSIYGINRNSLHRVTGTAARAGVDVTITTGMAQRGLTKLGFDVEQVRVEFVPKRDDYLRLLAGRTFHILALDWPDETSFDVHELNTIFPTKAVDYLASGRPILIHCPKEYYLARFFREHGCGLVVDERSDSAIDSAIRRLVAGGEDISAMAGKALEVVQQHRVERVVSDLRQAIATPQATIIPEPI